MNARPTVQFKYRLASHLKKTIAEIDAMDSREFSSWIAWATWFCPLDHPWLQTGTIVSYLLTPHMGGKSPPEPEKFIPIQDKTPQHPTQIEETIRRMAADLAKK